MYLYQEFARRLCAGLVHNDVALQNLVCGMELPGARVMDIDLCLRTLDTWTDRAKSYTARSLPQFQKNPARFNHSEPYFRVLCLITYLQRDCGVRYNPAKIRHDAVFEPADSFIYGIIQGDGGTCATLPVVYVAVGRRLGYPLMLVEAKGKDAAHLFARWNDGRGCQFNIEASAQGLSCHPDDYYRNGLYSTTPQDEQLGGFLKSMGPRQEFAFFLGQAFHCWRDIGNYRHAADTMAWASALCPHNAFFLNTLKATLNEWLRSLKTRQPPDFPEIIIDSPRRRFPITLPAEFERDMLSLEALEYMLDDPKQNRQWWEPMLQGRYLQQYPVQAQVRYNLYKCDIHFELGSGSGYSLANRISV
jgi:hypothetical protein